MIEGGQPVPDIIFCDPNPLDPIKVGGHCTNHIVYQNKVQSGKQSREGVKLKKVKSFIINITIFLEICDQNFSHVFKNTDLANSRL